MSSHLHDSVLTIVVSGEIDLSTCPTVGTAINEALASSGAGTVQVDLSAVKFMDSSGIALLLKGRRSADERGMAYRVIGAQGITRQALEMTGVWAHLSGESGHSSAPGHDQPTGP